MYKIIFLKKQKNVNFFYDITIQKIFEDLHMYFIFSKNFFQKFLQRPSKKKNTRNKKIKNDFLENENFFYLSKNLLNINKKKNLKKKIKLLELFNQF